ncbi:MAG: gliding motility protein GldN [Bacteroidaceae bacterium]|nr:gliding motility protein GldN [Bacteroidaceae bacterium]
MKRILSFITVTLLVASAATAQPTRSRAAATSRATEQAGKPAATDRASLMFPTTAAMPDDVVWKRDIYRQLDLTKDKNAPMYYPVEPMGKQVNLFTYLFRLILTGRVNAYTYKLDGNESFDEKDKLAVKDLLERYGIYYEENGGKMTVADSDVPSAEATRYYLKESIYMDQRTGTFSTKVTALCPVLMRGADEFSSDATPYPLFWVKYDDIAPWLAKLPMMPSDLNNVTNMTADDFFAMNRYDGKIYKTNNMQGKMLHNYCETDSDMVAEQKRIEKQISDFEKNVWGDGFLADTTKKDSLDAEMAAKEEKKSSKGLLFGRKSAKEKSSSTSAKNNDAATKKEKEAPANTSARVSARRQRR